MSEAIRACQEKPTKYRDDAVVVYEDGSVTIKGGGRCVTMLPEQWVSLFAYTYTNTEMLDRFRSAIEWHFSPSDSIKVFTRLEEYEESKERETK